MKTKLIFLSSLIVINLGFNYAFSAGIYENANQSAEFLRTLTRYASTDIDSAFYNPAGTVFIKDGFYGYFSDQMLFDYQTMTDSSPSLSGYSYPDKYEGEAMTWAFPDICALYKKDNWSSFIHMGLIGRGAAATYSEGLPMINKAAIGYATGVTGGAGTLQSIKTDGELEAYAFFIGMTAGGAYQINDIFSLGGGVRYVHAEQNTKLKYNFINVTKVLNNDITASGAFPNIDVDVDADGDSAGIIGSFDVKPLNELIIGFRYEYYTTMKVKNQKPNKYYGPALLLSQFPLAKGDIVKMTLPMNAAAGISYMIIPQLKVEAGFLYYFNKLANWGKDSDGKQLAEKYDNGYDASISIEYAILTQLKGSVGYSYSVSGVNSKTRNNQMLGLDAHSLGLGGTYSFANGMDLTLAGMKNFFKEETVTNTGVGDSGSTKYKEDVYGVAGSVSYKFM